VTARHQVLALLALGAAAVSTAAAATDTSPRTMVVANVTPFTADGHLRAGLRVVQQTTVICTPDSAVVPNNAYRCGTANFFVDPCWRDFRSTSPAVVCLGRPWARTAIRFRLTAAPARPRGGQPLKSEPWGIQLRSGARCLVFEGAHSTLTGKEGAPWIDYYCVPSLALLRGIDRSHPTWTIRAARITHRLSHPYKLIGRVAIKTAWFGGSNPLSHHP
jgi:hypothetical protein